MFTEVITGAFHVDEHLPESMDEIGEFLVRQVTDDTGEGDDAGFNPLRMLLLAAASPETAQLVSKQFHAEFVRPLARKLHGRNTEMRSALIAAHVIGLATVRHLLKSPSLQGREPRPIIAMVGAAIQACVDAPLREEEKRLIAVIHAGAQIDLERIGQGHGFGQR